ncbi:MAG: lipoyl protein ligase domain-containing protein [Acidimicrobiales bacterium]
MTADPSAPWRIERVRGPAGQLLAPWPRPDDSRAPVVRLARLVGPTAVVLGSTQATSVVDTARAAAAGIEVVTRPTGGGAVAVAPDAQVWLDAWVPRGHVLWDDDVIAAASWLGDTWRRALAALGAPAVHVHRGPAVCTAWSGLICFAGVGPAELCVAAGGAKITGLAQRRTRSGARFHVSAPLVWDPVPLVGVLAPERLPAPPDVAARVLADVAVGLRPVAPALAAFGNAEAIAVVEEAAIASLP